MPDALRRTTSTLASIYDAMYYANRALTHQDLLGQHAVGLRDVERAFRNADLSVRLYQHDYAVRVVDEELGREVFYYPLAGRSPLSWVYQAAAWYRAPREVQQASRAWEWWQQLGWDE